MNLNPASQLSLFGHQNEFLNFIELYQNQKLPNKILLSGEKGIGKSTLAYHIINYILSNEEDFSYDNKNFKINPDNKTYKLITNKSNPNFISIDVDTDKKNIDINQIRNLILSLNKSSFNDKPRFVLIDNIELMNTNSVNALLKILEEPNDNIFFILINNNKKILPTLKSRCLNYKIHLTSDQSFDITNKILGKNFMDLINDQMINNYSTPGVLLNLIDLANRDDINLKEINLKDYKLKKNNFPVIPVLLLLILLGLIYNYDDILLNKNIQTDLKEESNRVNEIEEEVNSNVQSHQDDSTKNITTKEDSVVFNSITEINHITGNYYIISGSFSNYNLSLNKANNLMDKGFDAIIIFPVSYNNKYRVAIKKFNNVDEAKQNLPSYKKQLNDELWILKH